MDGFDLTKVCKDTFTTLAVQRLKVDSLVVLFLFFSLVLLGKNVDVFKTPPWSYVLETIARASSK